MKPPFLSQLLAACLVTGINASPAATNPTVTIDSGMVIGTAAAITLADKSAIVHNYLGLPFAAVPTGALRFAPPSAPTPWSRPLAATALASSCMQQFSYPKPQFDFIKAQFNNPGGPPPPESEDCLYINVYAPEDASPQNKKSVLFWIYGGNLAFGSSYPLFYNGSVLAGFQDMVVVTFNYRTNIFGFPGSLEIHQNDQNPGLLDQRFALEWTSRNIAQFGGDPRNVTIFGESAGGASVKQILAQPPPPSSSPLPFRAAILQSEGATIPGDAASSFVRTLARFGCTNIACLRRVSAEDISRFISEKSVNFPPVANNISWTTDVRPSIASGRFAQVPLLMGTNADEGRIFAAATGIDNNTSIDDFFAAKFPGFPDVARAAAAYYAPLIHDLYLYLSTVITDFGFTCTASALSQFARLHGYGVWRYRYSAVFATLGSFPDAGAYHNSEIPQVFGTYPTSNQYGNVTSTQQALSSYMQATWAGFAKDPFAGPGWEQVGSTESETLAELGGTENPVGRFMVSSADVDAVCPIYNRIIDRMGL